MIFQNSNKKSAQDDPAVAMPVAQPAEEAANQDDQELARVLADIDSQVNNNNDNLMADLEQATEAEQTPAEEATEAPVAFEKIEQEATTEVAPAMTDFQPAEIPGVADESGPESSLDQQFAAMSQQISDNMAELEADQQPAVEETEVAEKTTEPEAVVSAIEPIAPVESITESGAPVSNLDELRKKALTDLRPIVDKVELNDEESFDVLLLLIRETDDESLLPRAYEAARQIQDEARRAQALLDVIKEADYFKHKA